MNLNFIGRGAAFYTQEGNTSAYFIENDCLFLIDCGETVFSKLMEKNILTSIKQVYVLISHTHCDHCGSLGSLGFYCQYMLHLKLKIIVPHHHQYLQNLQTLMSLYGNTDDAYVFLFEEEVDSLFQTFSTVRYELTQHDDGIPCFSFVFETPDGAVFYSADTRTTENISCFIANHQQIQRIYMEVTDLKIPNDIHLNIDILKQAIPSSLRSQVFLMHIRSDQCIVMAKEAGFQIVKC